MNDFLGLYVIFTLIAVVIIQAVERVFYSSHMQEEQSKLIKAVLSKDVKEYTQAIKAENQTQDVPVESDEIPLSEATDEEFDKLIKQQTQ